MNADIASLLRQASKEAISAIRAAKPEIAANHEALSIRFSAEALRRLANHDRCEGRLPDAV